MKQIQSSLILERITVCPYCMDDKSQSEPWHGCCGESSAHFQPAIVTQDETFLESEVEIVENEGVSK